MKRQIYSDEIIRTCKQIGMNLQALRIKRLNETQDIMAARLGVSRGTYNRMENGDPRVNLGYWLEAARITRSIDQWHSLFTLEESLFDQLDQSGRQQPPRKRVRKA